MARKCFICSCCGKSKPSTQRILLGGDALVLRLRSRSTPHSATAAASGCTAETLDKSITAQFVHNAVDKSMKKSH